MTAVQTLCEINLHSTSLEWLDVQDAAELADLGDHPLPATLRHLTLGGQTNEFFRDCFSALDLRHLKALQGITLESLSDHRPMESPPRDPAPEITFPPLLPDSLRALSVVVRYDGSISIPALPPCLVSLSVCRQAFLCFCVYYCAFLTRGSMQGGQVSLRALAFVVLFFFCFAPRGFG